MRGHLHGGSIDDLLRAGVAPPVPRALEWVADAAAALDRAHSQDVVHGDVKPANLILSDDDRIEVVGFGVAPAVDLDSPTQTGAILGIAGYLSPEQAEGKKATPASDRYSLAAVAFELLSGRRPFERMDAASEAAAHARAPVPPISAIRPELPAEMSAVFDRALAKDPAARFPTCAEFVAALRAADAVSTRPTQIITLQSTHPQPRTRRTPALGSRSRLPPQLLVLLGMAAIAAGVVTAVLLSQRSPQRAAETVQVTVTDRGTTSLRTVTETVLRTVTEQPPPPKRPPRAAPKKAASAPSSPATASAVALKGYRRMRSGDYLAAIPLLERAAAALNGTGSREEAYNDYNLARSLAETRGCSTRVLRLLDASEAIQGRRRAIDRLRKACTH